MMDKKRTGYIRQLARKTIDNYFKKNPPPNLPIPIDKIAEYHGFEIFELDTLDSNQSAVIHFLSQEDRKLIGLNKNSHVHHRRFSVGHELGHYIIGHPAESECTDEEIKLYNQEADEFSAEILMPLDLLKIKLKEVKDAKQLSSLFLVSEHALWIKIKNQNLLKLL